MTLLSPLSGTLSPLGVSAGRRRGVQSEFCLGFDGVDSYVDCGTDASLAITGELSVCMWMRHAPVTTTFNSALVANAQALSSECNYVTSFSFASAGCVDFWNHFGGPSLTSIGRVDNGAWHHVVFTRTGSAGAWTLSVYIDGRLDKTVAAAINPQNPVTPATAIGRLGGYDGYYFGGQLDDVRIYSRALTADEISAIYVNTTPPPTDGLVAYFPLDEGTGTTTTDSVAGLVGTFTGGPTWQPQTPPRLIAGRNTEDWSVSFDGNNDYVTVPNSVALNPSTFTLSAWVKWNLFGINTGLLTKDQSSGNRSYALWTSSEGRCGIVVMQANGSEPVALSPLNSVTTGIWYLITGTFDGANLILYINGLQVATTPATDVVSSTAAVQIGWFERTNAFHNGLLKDARIYNTALPAASIATLARGKEPTETPVARWRLNEGTGTTATDSIGSNHGTLTNGPTWTGDVPTHFRQVIESTQALSLDGTDDYILVPDSDSLSFLTGGMSIAAWVKRNADTANDSILDKYAAANHEYEYTFGFSGDNKLYAWVYDNTSSQYMGRSAPDVNSGGWHHVVFTFNGGTTPSSVKLFVDGVQADNVDFASGGFTAMRNTTQPVGIGRANAGFGEPSSYFDGLIDEVCIFTRDLSPPEVADLSLGFIVSAGLVSRYKLDGSAVDSVGTNHGTENGGVGYSTDTPGTL